MKKLAVVAGLAGLVSAGLAIPAHAEPADPAPTSVQISWKDETFQFVHVTWDEDVPRPNAVYLRVVGSATKKSIRYLPADGPNEIDLPAATVRLAGYKLVIDVAVGTAAGETSTATDSAAFDTIPAAAPTSVTATMSGSSTVKVSWKPGTSVNTDTTPGDPLDRNLQAIFQPMYRKPGAAAVPLGSRTAATTITFSDPKPSYLFFVQARNEWPDPADPTAANSSTVDVEQVAPTASIPTWVIAGQNTVIRGTFHGPPAKVILHARNSETSPWYVVTSGDFSNGSYSFTLPSRGTRQYRVVAGNKAAGATLWFGGYTPVVTTTTQQKVTMALAKSTVVRGYSSWGTLTVKPAVQGFADLQRWNGKTWVHVKNNAIIDGIAYFDMPYWAVGAYTYRYYSAERVYNGLLVGAAYSQNFTVKVIP